MASNFGRFGGKTTLEKVRFRQRRKRYHIPNEHGRKRLPSGRFEMRLGQRTQRLKPITDEQYRRQKDKTPKHQKYLNDIGLDERRKPAAP